MSRTTALGCLRVVAAAIGLVAAMESSSLAVYLDENQNWALRMRAYSQAAVRLRDSRSEKTLSPVSGQLEESQTVPETFNGQLVQNRWFFNPELDVKLTPYMNWMSQGWLKWLAPDDLRMRVAGWGFYDGIYDYGPDQFDDQRRLINKDFNRYVPASQRPDRIRESGWYLEGSKVRLPRDPDGTVRVNDLQEIFPGADLKDPRETYGHQRRINEFYLSYSKGPFFVRAGKQSISWGESDTIALLDQTNPFSVLLGAPGFFQDIDEARIPLWTLRTSYDVFSSLGPFSSGFIEGYWVPGDIDTTTGEVPILTASPYSPPGSDPQRGNPIFPSTYQFIFFDQVPEKSFDNSRYGFRFQTVYDRFLTLQAWFYTTFPQIPVPQKIGLPPNTGNRDIQVVDSNGQATNLFIISLQHKLTSVYGVSGTFFSEWLDGIVRLNAQMFENEPGFIPDRNLNIERQPETILGQGDLPRTDVLRYEIGYDRFFFFRPLNPSNSFILASSIVGFWNLDHTGNQDFRAQGLFKRGIKCSVDNASGNDIRSADECRAAGGVATQRGNEINDYVQQKEAEAQAQITLQSDWMHGTIQPRVTTIVWTRGTWAVHPSVTYRWNDWLLFGADFQWIGGDFQSLGFFQDRGQASVRITYQLN